MTPKEARAVIDLWTQRQERADVPSVNDVAEGLGISPAEVELLLQDIRSRQTMTNMVQSFPSGWKLVHATPERAKSQAFWERLILTILICLVTAGIMIWTAGMAFTFNPSFAFTADVKWFVGIIDVGLWSGLFFGWKSFLRHITHRD